MKFSPLIILSLFCQFLTAAPVVVKVLTPINKKKPTQIVPIQYEAVPQAGRPLRSQPKELPTFWEAPFPGMVPVMLKAGVAKNIFKQESGALFEETEITLSDGKKKRVCQRVIYGTPEVVTGESQALDPVSRTELGRYFSENFRSGTSQEDYSRTLFVLQTMDEKQVNFSLPCRHIKSHRADVLQKVQISREIFELLMSGACP